MACALQLRPLASYDVFYHRAIGGWMVENLAIPRTGLFSATRERMPWVDNEYGFQLLVALAEKGFGIAGLVLLQVGLVLLTLAFLARLLRRSGAPPIAACAALGLTALALCPHDLRPQLVTYALLAATLVGISDLVERRSLRPVLSLPLIACIWANMHAGFIVGLVAVGIATFSAFAGRLLGRDEGPARVLLIAFSLCIAASFLNPYGWRQVHYPIRYVIHPEMASSVLEWRATVPTEHPWLLLQLVAAGVAMMVAPIRPRLTNVLLLVAFAWFALQATRHVWLLAIVATAAAAPSWAALGELAIGRVSPRARPFLAAAIVVSILLPLSWSVVPGNPLRVSPLLVLPTAAADFLSTHPIEGQVLNQYEWGGYLMHRGLPQFAFMDGRNDLHGPEGMENYLIMLEARPGYRELLDSFEIGGVLLAATQKNARLLGLLSREGWACVHRSEVRGIDVVLLVRPSRGNEALIRTYRVPFAIDASREIEVPPQVAQGPYSDSVSART